MNKKGNFKVIIIGFFILLLIGIIIFIFAISIQKIKKDSQTPVTLPNATGEVFVSAYKYLTNLTVPSRADIDNQLFDLSSGFNQINMSLDITKIFCLTDGYYSSENYKEFSTFEKNNNKAKLSCDIKKQGDLIISKISGSLDAIDNDITLNLSSNDFFNNLNVCFQWSAGIIKVDTNQPTLLCEQGWKNYSFVSSNMTYFWLPNSTYQCGEKTEQCDSIVDHFCLPKQPEFPSRFNKKVDKCLYTGISINSTEPYILNFKVKTLENKNPLDFLTIYFFDSDRLTTNDYTYYSEFEDINIGNPIDFNYTISFPSE